MLNRQVFERDPLEWTIPNDGVAKLAMPRTAEEWRVARYEVEAFVCEGSYHDGLRRMLEAFLYNLDQPVQRAAWVHGFYGSGKSHLVRLLQMLWIDLRFPDGATARGLAHLPQDINDLLVELTRAGARTGGLWAAAGTLAAGAKHDPRLDLLSLVLRAAGLPERLELAELDLWLRENGWREPISKALAAKGRSYERELRHGFASTALAEELLVVNPQMASDTAGVLQVLKTIPARGELTTDNLVAMLGDVFDTVTPTPERRPLVLLVIDELQQYLGDDPRSLERALSVQEAVEACVSRFESQVMVVATGQSALASTPVLQKLQGRFSLHVELKSQDVEAVLRKTVLAKKSSALPDLRGTLEQVRGEIDRHLAGSRLAVSADTDTLAADYPLLPSRRRFWEYVLRAVDTGGASGELRNQMRLAYEAAKATAPEELGCVPGADFIFDQQRVTLIQTGKLLGQVGTQIGQVDDGTERGRLKARVCALLYLIAQIDRTLGVTANPDTLADLLVTDLRAGSAALRQEVPGLLAELVESGVVAQVGDQYQIQTPEGAAWDREYTTELTAIRHDQARMNTEREQLLRAAVERELQRLALRQGASQTPRHFELHFGPDAPVADGKVPVWVRSGWEVNERAVQTEAAAAGPESPVVFVFLPRPPDDDLRDQIAGRLAAEQVVATRPAPTTDDGRVAEQVMRTRASNHLDAQGQLVGAILDAAKVYQGGGQEVGGMELQGAVETACGAALVRLYPDFGVADSAHWSTAADRARRGSPDDALQALNYSGAVDQHPVCRQVLDFVGAGKTGNEVRRHFEEPPFGWPRDAIDAALLILTGTGHLVGQRQGRPVTLPLLDRTAIGQTQFRTQSQVVTVEQRIALRRLLQQQLGMPCQSGEELVKTEAALASLLQLAQTVGGEPPLPGPPSAAYLLDLQGRDGNGLLAGVYEQRERLAADHATWTALAEQQRLRWPRWQRLERLLQHARELPVYAHLAPEVEAIKAQRLLLADPDPVPGLIGTLAGALREAVAAARERYLDVYRAKIAELQADANWARLGGAEQERIRADHDLGPLPPLQVGTDQELLATLDATPLPVWEHMMAAVAQRVSDALLDAARAAQPQTRRVPLRLATVHNQDELESYLAEVRAQVLAALAEGPVVLP